MNSFEISLLVFLCLVAGFFLGMQLRFRLPDHHLSKESQDTIKLGAGMVATMSALVLGLLVSSAKSSFDAVNTSIAQNGARIIQLDRLLAEYGPETRACRDQLKTSVAERVGKVWSKSSPAGSGLQAVEKSTTMLDLQASLRALTPQTDLQKSLLLQSLQISTEIWQSRLLLVEEQQEPLPAVFLVLLVFWLAMLFMSFGLFAPRNVTVSVVQLVCAFSVSSAVFLILEMNHPLSGFIKVSSAPMVKALEFIGH
jgi:Protein of unknown function (DUF4239)